MGRKYKAPPFVMLRKDLLRAKEWRGLSSSAKIIYIYLRGKFNTQTLSEVSLAYSEVTDMFSSQTISNALKQLQVSKFIEKTEAGGLLAGISKYKFIGLFKDFYYKNGKFKI